MERTDVLVIGAGVVGAACAYYAARAGLRVTVVDRGPVAGGTTGAGEGNLLVSDKGAGPELDLALRSTALWAELAAELTDGGGFEYEAKGGLVTAADAATVAGLAEFARGQRAAGVRAEPVAADDLAALEPWLAKGLAGGMFYPQDSQVQPMLAAARLLRAARDRHGARLRTGVEVTGFLRSRDGRITGVGTPAGPIHAGSVVNAAGTWGGRIAALAGAPVPVLPRRGFILVTAPLPPRIRHKVYSAEYVANVASDGAGLETSAVVEGTPAGTVLIGASRERVGFDRTLSLPVLKRLAAQAVGLFPFLADVPALRTYCGFRPYCPDHLPVIGADPRAPGLLHACGHEGAGIGLAPVTGLLISQILTDAVPEIDPAPFRPDRFPEEP